MHMIVAHLHKRWVWGCFYYMLIFKTVQSCACMPPRRVPACLRAVCLRAVCLCEELVLFPTLGYGDWTVVLRLWLGESSFYMLALRLLVYFFFFFFFFFFFNTGFICIARGVLCTGTHFVDQAGLELRNPPAYSSRVLGLKSCTTTPGVWLVFWEQCLII